MRRFAAHSLLRFSNDHYTEAAKQKNVRETFKFLVHFFEPNSTENRYSLCL